MKQREESGSRNPNAKSVSLFKLCFLFLFVFVTMMSTSSLSTSSSSSSTPTSSLFTSNPFAPNALTFAPPVSYTPLELQPLVGLRHLEENGFKLGENGGPDYNAMQNLNDIREKVNAQNKACDPANLRSILMNMDQQIQLMAEDHIAQNITLKAIVDLLTQLVTGQPPSGSDASNNKTTTDSSMSS